MLQMNTRRPPRIRRRRLPPSLQQQRPRIRQPDFSEPRPDGKDPDSGYDGPGLNKDNKQPKPEQPDIKF